MINRADFDEYLPHGYCTTWTNAEKETAFTQFAGSEGEMDKG